MGHYDECRPGYCEICGQTEGNCEHTKKKIVKENKNFLDSIDELNKFRHENEISVKKSLNYKIWFIADTHFDHKNIINYCARPYHSISEMNEALIKNWNSVVSNQDKIFMVGDFALSSKKRIIELGKQLNGHKTLILGNHDGASKETYYEAGFEYISRQPIIFEDFFIVSHEPQFIQQDGLYINIFGHVHDNPIFKDCSSRSFCVSAERINYTPIEFEEIKKRIEKENEL